MESALESVFEALVVFLFWPHSALSICIRLRHSPEEGQVALVGESARSSVISVFCSYAKWKNRLALAILSPVGNSDAPLTQVAGNCFPVPVCRFLLVVVSLPIMDSVQRGSTPRI